MGTANNVQRFLFEACQKDIWIVYIAGFRKTYPKIKSKIIIWGIQYKVVHEV